MNFVLSLFLVILSIALVSGHRQSIKCDICKWGIKEVLDKTVVDKGCDEGTELFVGVCVGILTFEGGDAACVIGGVAFKELCDHEGEDWIKAHESDAVTELCDDMHLC